MNAEDVLVVRVVLRLELELELLETVVVELTELGAVELTEAVVTGVVGALDPVLGTTVTVTPGAAEEPQPTGRASRASAPTMNLRMRDTGPT